MKFCTLPKLLAIASFSVASLVSAENKWTFTNGQLNVGSKSLR